MKKYLLFAVALIMTFVLTACDGNGGTSDAAGNEPPKDLAETAASDFRYEIRNNEVTITAYIGESNRVRIPEKIEGHPVVSIGGIAGGERNSMLVTEVYIPNGVTTIREWAFNGSQALKSIALPDSVTKIEENAFSMSHIENVTLGNGLTEIGPRAFAACGKLTAITIPDSVTTIGSNAFSMSGLTGIIIPDSVTSIGTDAFWSCYNLTDVTIGKGLTSIGMNVFQHCESLTSVIIPDNITSIGRYAFGSTGLTSIIVPESVTQIDTQAFHGSRYLANAVFKGVSYSAENFGNDVWNIPQEFYSAINGR